MEVGAVFDDLLDQKPLDLLPRFHCYVRSNLLGGEPYALSMHPKILRRIAEQEPGFTYLWPGEVTREFKKFLLQHVPTAKDGVNVAGKNFDGLDRLFLEKLPKFKEEIKLRHRVIDPAILYWQPGDETLPGTELCYQRAGLEPVAAHTAIEDALGVIQLVRKKLAPLATPCMTCPDCGQRYYYPDDGKVRINFCKPCMNKKHQGILVPEKSA